MNCLHCGQDFESSNKHRKYCGHSCAALHGRPHLAKEGKTWNKGLTKTDNPNLSKSGVKPGSIPWNKGKTGVQVIYNKGKTKENCPGVAKAAKTHTGHPCYKGSGIGKCGYRADIGHYVRSTWEANVCRILQFRGIAYEYEPRRFDLGDTTYCPDFGFANGRYWEIKGYQTAEWKAKFAKFRMMYPEVEIAIIDSKEYSLMANSWKDFIPSWEK